MEVNLSAEGEGRLRITLIDTLEEAVRSLAHAFDAGDEETIKKVGHTLKGNSGAYYFGFTQVKEIGEKLEKDPRQSEEEIRRMIGSLEQVTLILREQ